MNDRCEEIAFEFRQFRRLEGKLVDSQKLRDDIMAVIAKLEAEKATLSSDNN